jgi:23S rRNA G2445 N2-methylase RlmL
MKCLALVNNGLEELSLKELSELVSFDGKISKNTVEFELDSKEKLLELSKKIQSVRRLLVYFGKVKNWDDFEFGKFSWKDFLSERFTFRVEVDGVRGQENRTKISKDIAGKFFSVLENEEIKPEIDLKKPGLLFVVYFNGSEYFFGIDFKVEELNSREYRVFAHQASFKGDLAYFFARESGFSKGEKMLVCFAKDGAIAIEAGLFAEGKIYTSDESQGNVVSARKNVKLAGMQEIVEVKKYSLEDLDVKFSENEFDRLIFHITSKDEERINEIYYQASYILRKGGTFLLIGRDKWEVSISDKFKLLREEKIIKGESATKFWLLEKN